VGDGDGDGEEVRKAVAGAYRGGGEYGVGSGSCQKPGTWIGLHPYARSTKKYRAWPMLIVPLFSSPVANGPLLFVLPWVPLALQC